MPVQQFNPDNVLLSEKQDGTFTPEMTNVLMKDIAQNSLVMQLGTYVEMNGKQEKKFSFQADGLSAYWVDEGQKIQTSKPGFAEATMRAKKLGVIILASREYLTYTWSQFFAEMQPQIQEAFYKKIDQAALLNTDNPFAFSVEEAATAAGNVITGEFTQANILALEDAIYEGDNTLNAFVSTNRNHTALRTQSIDAKTGEALYDRQTRQIDGLPTVISQEVPAGTIYAGDWTNMRYGVPYNITFKISEEGTLSTIKNADGSDVNLFEQELIAMRATMDFAFMTVKDDAFGKLVAGEADGTPEV